jgi:YgiT-type zinc finger domain-containing protein
MHKYGGCSFCEGQVENSKIELDYGYKEKLYTFKDMPGEICQQCNEKYLTAEAAKEIEYRIKKKIDNII